VPSVRIEFLEIRAAISSVDHCDSPQLSGLLIPRHLPRCSGKDQLPFDRLLRKARRRRLHLRLRPRIHRLNRGGEWRDSRRARRLIAVGFTCQKDLVGFCIATDSASLIDPFLAGAFGSILKRLFCEPIDHRCRTDPPSNSAGNPKAIPTLAGGVGASV